MAGEQQKQGTTRRIEQPRWLILADREHVVTVEGFELQEFDEKIADAEKALCPMKIERPDISAIHAKTKHDQSNPPPLQVFSTAIDHRGLLREAFLPIASSPLKSLSGNSTKSDRNSGLRAGSS